MPYLISITNEVTADIKNTLSAKGAYHGDIQLRENIGKTKDEFVAMWNKDHPDDVVV